MPDRLACSSCSAPLDLTSINSRMVRCPYCANTMILPEEFGGARGSARPAKQSLGSIIDRSVKLGEIARLAHSGNKIEAIKLYRETFGVGLKEAKDAVEQIERGEPIAMSDTEIAAEGFSFESLQPDAIFSAQAIKSQKRVAIFVAVFVIAIIAIVGAIIIFSVMSSKRIISSAMQQTNIPFPIASSKTPASTNTSASTPGVASSVLEFGSEGIGAGQFQDARSIAVDGEGHIYVGEYTGGRVQVFDSTGKFITQWMVDSKPVLLNLAADRKGTVYVVHPGHIYRYEGLTGNLLGEVPGLLGSIVQFYTDVFVALDGSLYAVGSNSNIIRIDSSGKLKTVVDLKAKLEENVSLDKIAVDGTGNIFALTEHDCTVLKFAPDGRFINRFGGRGEKPGQLRAPQNIAVDGQGRVYVSDMNRAINIFDSNGLYQNYFGGSEAIFGIIVNDQNQVLACLRNRHKIVKYSLNQ